MTNPTFNKLLDLTREAGRNSHYHLEPRYTCGSPALVPMGVCLKVAVQEFEAHKNNLTGVFGEEARRKAEIVGLKGIAYARWEKGAQVWRLDLLTGETFIEPERLSWEEKDRLRELRHNKAWFDAHPPEQMTAKLLTEMAALEERATIHREEINNR